MSHSIGCVCVYRMHAHLRVFMSSHPPEIKLSECAFAATFITEYVNSVLETGSSVLLSKWVVQCWTTQGCDLFSAELVNMFN